MSPRAISLLLLAIMHFWVDKLASSDLYVLGLSAKGKMVPCKSIEQSVISLCLPT